MRWRRPRRSAPARSGVAPCRITPSAPRSNWPRTAATHCSGMPVAAGAEPLVGDQRGDVLELLGGGDAGRSRPRTLADHRVGPERGRARPGPSRWCDQQVAVALEVGGQATDGLLEAQRLGDVVADGGEARPHPHRRRGRGRPARRPASPSARSAAVVSSVKKVCSTTSSKARPPSASELVAEGDEAERDVLVEVRVEAQHGPGPGRAVVAEDHLAVPQPAHEPGEVLHLRGGDPRDAEGVLHQR